MAVKLGGPKNYYAPTDCKKIGLKDAEDAINKNIQDIATNAADIVDIKAKDVEQDGKITALEGRPVLPTGGTGDNGKVVTYDEANDDYILTTPASGGGVDADVIADEYDSSYIITPGHVYNQFDVVYDSTLDLYYACKENNVTGVWDSTKWQVLTVGEKPDTQWGSIVVNAVLTPTSAPQCSILEEVGPGSSDYYIYAQQWGSVTVMSTDDPTSVGLTAVNPSAYAGEGHQEWGTTYHEGDYVMYEDELYVCDYTTGGTWNPNDWTKVTVMSQINSSPSPTPTQFIPRYSGLNTVSQIGKTNENGPVYQVLLKFASGTSSRTVSIPSGLEFNRIYAITPFIYDTDAEFFKAGSIGNYAIQIIPSTTSFEVQCVGSLTDTEVYVEVIFSAYQDE